MTRPLCGEVPDVEFSRFKTICALLFSRKLKMMCSAWHCWFPMLSLSCSLPLPELLRSIVICSGIVLPELVSRFKPISGPRPVGVVALLGDGGSVVLLALPDGSGPTRQGR